MSEIESGILTSQDGEGEENEASAMMSLDEHLSDSMLPLGAKEMNSLEWKCGNRDI